MCSSTSDNNWFRLSSRCTLANNKSSAEMSEPNMEDYNGESHVLRAASSKCSTDEPGIITRAGLFEQPQSPSTSQAELVSNSSLESNVLIDLDLIHHHLNRLCTLADLIRGVYCDLQQHESLIDASLKHVWETNADIKKRGLRGGTARRARRLGMQFGKKYAPIHRMSPQDNQRRMEVEKVDFLGRSRITGLRILQGMLETNHKYVREQQNECRVILGHVEELMAGVTTPLESRLGLAANKLLSEDQLGKIDEIEEMLEIIHEELYL
jgi:hypothetical protein